MGHAKSLVSVISLPPERYLGHPREGRASRSKPSFFLAPVSPCLRPLRQRIIVKLSIIQTSFHVSLVKDREKEKALDRRGLTFRSHGRKERKGGRSRVLSRSRVFQKGTAEGRGGARGEGEPCRSPCKIKRDRAGGGLSFYET